MRLKPDAEGESRGDVSGYLDNGEWYLLGNARYPQPFFEVIACPTVIHGQTGVTAWTAMGDRG